MRSRSLSVHELLETGDMIADQIRKARSEKHKAKLHAWLAYVEEEIMHYTFPSEKTKEGA